MNVDFKTKKIENPKYQFGDDSKVYSSNITIGQVCTLCKNPLEPSEGDVVFGSEWYHKNCWRLRPDNDEINPGKNEKKNVCTLCKSKLEPAEGDVVFGSEFYHLDCWKLLESLEIRNTNEKQIKNDQTILKNQDVPAKSHEIFEKELYQEPFEIAQSTNATEPPKEITITNQSSLSKKQSEPPKKIEKIETKSPEITLNKVEEIKIKSTKIEDSHQKKILIIGLGQIGFSNAEYMSSIGLKVDGFDISEQAITRALDSKVIQNRATSFSGYDYYVVCISTHRPENMFVPYLDGLFEVTKRIAHEGKPGSLVGIDSTITRGTSEKIKELLGHKQHVAHVPHRFYVHEKKDHGVNQTRVLGGCDLCCEEKAKEFYGQILRIPLYAVSSVEVAELTKIVENSYRFMEIAFAEELKMVCDKSNVDFDELRKAINTKWNIKILEAKDGIGGHCLPKDSQMFLEFSKNSLVTSLIKAAKLVDLQYRVHSFKKIAPETPIVS